MTQTLERPSDGSMNPSSDPLASYRAGLQSYTKRGSTIVDYFIPLEKKKFNVQETKDRFKYLISLTPLFKHFLQVKAKEDEHFSQVLKQLEIEDDVVHASKKRKTEKEEDAELLNNENQEMIVDQEGELTDTGYEFTKSPKYINGFLRPYQIQGLNWLISLNFNNLSGILADEMGLGKTLQTISFLGYVRYVQGLKGPHIVIVPKSTLENWQREFAKWTPEVKTCILTGTQEERNLIIKDQIMTCKFDVLISSYEIVIREKAVLKKFNWQYIIVDEAHRLKNEDSLLSQIIRMFHSQNRLLITGTPLQNNLHELWALLNFILPDIFTDSATFDAWFSKEDDEDNSIVNQLHQVLKPFLLRRIKNDVEKSLLPKQELNVYVGMSKMQRKWYQSILEKDIDAVNGSNGKKESKTRLLNIVMQLRKCCNHPYLFEGAEPGPPFTTDEHLVYNSSKMLVLDKLLKRLREQGSRVLIFSQMSRMLDILEDYCAFREWGYCRIDGQTDHIDRINAIDEYNKEGSEKFVFLLTTRAGGLGINLTSADVVVLYDSDWNPQADLQAMDRAHRIGQKKQVRVFRFVTENAIEEKVLERASQKLRLDQLVIQQGRVNTNDSNGNSTANNKEELLNMIQHGAANILSSATSTSASSGRAGTAEAEDSHELDDDELEKILNKSEEKTGELKKKFSKLGLDDLQNFSSNGNGNESSVYEWNGQNFQKKEFGKAGIVDGIMQPWITPAKRERKGNNNYSVDGYYREVLQTKGGRVANADHGDGSGGDEFELRAPKNLTLYDHQFYDEELIRLNELEWNYYKRVNKIKAKKEKSRHHHHHQHQKEGEKEEDEEDVDVAVEQAMIDHARPLTEEEEKRKKELLMTSGFSSFSRRDFFTFIGANAKHGRYDLDAIAGEFAGEKSYEEVRTYAEAFWARFREVENYERYVGQIESGEDKLRRVAEQTEAVRRKVAGCAYPLRDLALALPYTAAAKREWSAQEDRWLVVQLARFGVGTIDVHERIWEAAQESAVLGLDFWLQGRSVAEIGRRCATLVGAVVREGQKRARATATASGKGSGKGRKKRKTRV